MPELPEVETVVRDLRPMLAGRTVTGVRQSKSKLRRPWKPAWSADATGARIEGVRRRGKWILIDLGPKDPSPTPPPGGEGLKTKGSALAPPSFLGKGAGGLGSSPLLRVHLGMTGQFTVVPAGAPEPDHLHLVFALDNKKELRLRDPRRFGSAEYFANRNALETEMNAELGPEPFDLDPDYFRGAVRGTRRNLKALLLDQKVVAGVGNIYADEACFRAGLHPGRPGKSLSPDECDRLRDSIEAVLTRAIESRGSTIRDYVGGSGLRGGFQNELAVYGRADEPCPTCETAIAVARHAGRASHYCPRCQPVKSKAGRSKVVKSKNRAP
ncbi:MAG: bifunctional DNA-formamidopyrimidine glycosylase/DNA-(apurinic or apyrimidinic site) lyase [Planctomycetes bacterium]|nr:bifunctional DNA-formamidopyrimidine glycosylase/DNA-(apurinic or apyrimidinic site) lyase [Planctomycetota bacterium]